MKIHHHKNPSKELTTLPQAVPKPKPDWIRLPRAGEKCPYSNLSRSTLNNLILPCKANKNVPPVKSAVVRQKGATRGVRLIHRASLMAYIAAGQEPAFEQEANARPSATVPQSIQKQPAFPRVQTFSITGKRTQNGARALVYGLSPKSFGNPERTQPDAPRGSSIN